MSKINTMGEIYAKNKHFAFRRKKGYIAIGLQYSKQLLKKLRKVNTKIQWVSGWTVGKSDNKAKLSSISSEIANWN
jgi:hypothetical protein